MLWLQGLITGFKQSSSRMSGIAVHPLSAHPCKAWDLMKLSQKVVAVEPLSPDNPISPRQVRFVCISDTHSRIGSMTHAIPAGDVLLHAGDFTNMGDANEVKKFNSFLGTLSHRHKVVIAGNHELSFDPNTSNRCVNPKDKVEECNQLKRRLTNAIYLEDSGVELFGIKIYGTPWQPEYGGWAFNIPRGIPCLEKWNLIPDDTDILISHGPPVGHGDICRHGTRAGCVELLTSVQQRIRPKFHVFGHIHEGYGVTSDEQTVFINCCICDVRYKACNAPIIFDYPLPDGVCKD